ncbi:hypothetical protein [Nostoc sp.]|uniref:hypothetical protein n=1 Tax=Nostoc sp. TaxID=1180 RepID=UPI002FF930D0
MLQIRDIFALNNLLQLNIKYTFIGIGVSDILHQVTRSHGYTGKIHLRGFKTLNFSLVRAGGLGLYSRDF